MRRRRAEWLATVLEQRANHGADSAPLQPSSGCPCWPKPNTVIPACSAACGGAANPVCPPSRLYRILLKSDQSSQGWGCSMIDVLYETLSLTCWPMVAWAGHHGCARSNRRIARRLSNESETARHVRVAHRMERVIDDEADIAAAAPPLLKST
jgi:hypothetical protein